MYMIGITGPSGSGKSTIAEKIVEGLASKTGYLMLDMYYRNNPGLTLPQRAAVNYDAPTAYDFDMLFDDLTALRAGRPIELKEYDFKNHMRKNTGVPMEPPEVLVIEGLHLFYDVRIRDMLDLRAYVQVDADICILRRLRRDIVERGRTVDSVIRQYTATVKPMYEMYVRGYAANADIILPNTDINVKPVDMVIHYVNNRMRAAADPPQG